MVVSKNYMAFFEVIFCSMENNVGNARSLNPYLEFCLMATYNLHSRNLQENNGKSTRDPKREMSGRAD
jgi:hypothetical protein